MKYVRGFGGLIAGLIVTPFPQVHAYINFLLTPLPPSPPPLDVHFPGNSPLIAKTFVICVSSWLHCFELLVNADESKLTPVAS